MVLLLVVLGITGNLFSSNPLVIAGQLLGLALIIYARIAFGRMYTGASLLLIVSIIGHLSLFTAAIGILVLIIIPWRINLEESQLNATYPDYAEYALRTKKLIPFVY